MPAPSSKERKAAVSRTNITINRIGFVGKRRPRRNDKKPSLFSKPDTALRRSK